MTETVDPIPAQPLPADPTFVAFVEQILADAKAGVVRFGTFALLHHTGLADIRFAVNANDVLTLHAVNSAITAASHQFAQRFMRLPDEASPPAA